MGQGHESRSLRPGLTVAIGILFAGPLTGGAINAVSFWDAHYVYWIGPMLGGAAGGFVYSKFLLPKT